MPRVYITSNDRLNARLAAWVYGQMKVQNVTQKMIADKRGVSRQAISKKLRARSFDYDDFLTFVEIFEPDDAELLRLVRG